MRRFIAKMSVRCSGFGLAISSSWISSSRSSKRSRGAKKLSTSWSAMRCRTPIPLGIASPSA
jgi:hypothetical protein